LARIAAMRLLCGGAIVVTAVSAWGASAQAATLVVATGDNLTLLEPRSAEYQAVIDVGAASRAVAVTKDGSTAFSVGGDEVVKVDLSSRTVVQRLTLPGKPRSVAVTDDGVTVLVGRQGAIDLLAAADLRRLDRIPLGRRNSTFLAARGERALSIDSRRRLRVLDLRRRGVLPRPKLAPVGGAAFTPDGRNIRAVIGTRSPRLVTLRADTGQRRGTRSVSTAGARGGVALSCNGRVAYVAPGATDRFLVAIDLRAGRLQRKVPAPKGPFVPVLGARGLLHLAGGQPFTNFVATYARDPLRPRRSLAIGEGQKPYGLAPTTPACRAT
jgi:DNA-binding beta-propeller fold protein YncE